MRTYVAFVVVTFNTALCLVAMEIPNPYPPY